MRTGNSKQRIFDRTTRLMHWLTAGLMLAQPILGLLQTSAHGDHVNLFFLGQLPALIENNRPLARLLLTAHKSVGFLLLGLVTLHVSAALFHHLWRRDDTLTAMLPTAAGWRPLDPRAKPSSEADAPPVTLNG